MKLRLWVLNLLFSAFIVQISGSCSDEGTPNSDGGTQVACGLSGPTTGSTCSSIADCGAGNAVHVSFCEHCFSRAELSACEAGTCRSFDRSGSIQIGFSVPNAAAGAKSFAVAALVPTAADGTKITCAALLSTCDVTNNDALNAFNSTFQNFTNGAANPNLAYTWFTSADVGTDRIAVVRVTTEVQGKGNVVAHGCTEGIEVRANETSTIEVTLTGAP